MKIISFALIATIIALFSSFLTSCSEKKVMTDNDIKFDTLYVAKFHHLNNDSTMPSCNLNVTLQYPIEYKDEKVLSEIQNFFIAAMFDESYAELSIDEVLEEYADDYVKNYTEDAKLYLNERLYSEIDPKDKYFSYYEDLSNTIVFNKGKIMSVQFVQSNKKGNKATFKHFSNYVLDMKTGKELNESDVFNEGYEKALNIIFKDKLLKANKVENIKDLEELGFTGIEEIIPNNNFLVDERGVTYIFNKEEYSVLQLDEIRIFIAYDEIPHVLKDESPITIFYKK